MRKAFLQACILFLLLAAPVALFLVRRADSGNDRRAEQMTLPPVSLERDEELAPPALMAQDDETPEAFFGEWEAMLSDSAGRTGPLERLNGWRAALGARPRAEAIDQLQRYWASRRDVAFDLPFAPGDGGALRSAPTLRTAVLDLFGRWDPVAAHQLAAVALEGSKESADEYALHLRNYAWGAPEGMDGPGLRHYLGSKALELVRHPPWQAEPSSGYQEAFDVLVWAGAVEAVPTLASLMTDRQPHSLVQPAGLALDRLVIEAPLPVLGQLLDDRDLLASRPRAKAGFFARVDPSDRSQRAMLEDYFLAADRSADDRNYLLVLFPNLNLRLSHNLLSEPHTFAHDEVIHRLEAARSMLANWATDSRFTAWRAEIERAHARLEETLPIE